MLDCYQNRFEKFVETGKTRECQGKRWGMVPCEPRCPVQFWLRAYAFFKMHQRMIGDGWGCLWSCSMALGCNTSHPLGLWHRASWFDTTSKRRRVITDLESQKGTTRLACKRLRGHWFLVQYRCIFPPAITLHLHLESQTSVCSLLALLMLPLLFTYFPSFRRFSWIII